ncbi:CLUMA_CG019519, isoform A [Clunio marinus]|uniref:CLUMA_CG019519, isoform A n=1 Tax=Clunio marinus TaxID=568069 RepID=A0A1J1J4V5_9DIPT|nr:CLUMA_CG019519, isoform A [Clunio marinus]
MAFALERFLFCLELQLGGIIMAWWGMIISALGIVGVISGLLFGKGHSTHFPGNISTGGAVTGGIISIILLLLYFYFSYQLLLGAQSGNSSQMIGYLVMHGIFVVLFILGVFQNAASLVAAIIYAYLWFCVYSLYVRSGGSAVA